MQRHGDFFLGTVSKEAVLSYSNPKRVGFIGVGLIGFGFGFELTSDDGRDS